MRCVEAKALFVLVNGLKSASIIDCLRALVMDHRARLEDVVSEMKSGANIITLENDPPINTTNVGTTCKTIHPNVVLQPSILKNSSTSVNVTTIETVLATCDP